MLQPRSLSAQMNSGPRNLSTRRSLDAPLRAARTYVGHTQQLGAGSKEAGEGALTNDVLPHDGPESSVEAHGGGVCLQARIPGGGSACSAVSLYRAPTGTSRSGGNAGLKRKKGGARLACWEKQVRILRRPGPPPANGGEGPGIPSLFFLFFASHACRLTNGGRVLKRASNHEQD